MSQLHCSMDTFQIVASNGFMSTLLDHCPFPKENHICSQLLTATLVGLKPSQWLMLLPLHVHSLFCHSILHGLGFQKMSPLTEGHSLPLLCGLLNTLLGVQHHRTTAYHPQANGIIERLHRQLKSVLKARLIGPAWMDELPLVLLGLRSAPKEDLGCSPSELVYGTTIRLPGEFFFRLQHHLLNKMCLDCLHVYVPLWLHLGQKRRHIIDGTPYTCPWTYSAVRLCSSDTMHTAHPYSTFMMDLFEFCRELLSTLPSISMVVKTLYLWIVSNLHL